MTIDQCRAFRSEGDLLTAGDVRRAADDGAVIAAAEIDGGKAEPVGIRVRRNLEHLRHAYALPVSACADDVPDFHARDRQPTGELVDR